MTKNIWTPSFAHVIPQGRDGYTVFWFNLVENSKRNSRNKTSLALFSQICAVKVDVLNEVSEHDNVNEIIRFRSQFCRCNMKISGRIYLMHDDVFGLCFTTTTRMLFEVVD